MIVLVMSRSGVAMLYCGMCIAGVAGERCMPVMPRSAAVDR
jgi:hypothetical protein